MPTECSNCGHAIAEDDARPSCAICGHVHGQQVSHDYAVDDQSPSAWRPYIKPAMALAAFLIALLLLRSCFLLRERSWDHPQASAAPTSSASPAKAVSLAKAATAPTTEPNRIGHEFNLVQMFSRRYRQVWTTLGDGVPQEPGQQVLAFQEIARDWNELNFSSSCLDQVRPVFNELLVVSADASAMVAAATPAQGRIASDMVLKSIADSRAFAAAVLRCVADDRSLSAGASVMTLMAAPASAPQAELSSFRNIGENWQAVIRAIKALPAPLNSDVLSVHMERLRSLDREWQTAKLSDACLAGMKPLVSRGLGATSSAVSALGLESPGAAARFNQAQEHMAGILAGAESCAGAAAE